jgi:riboflavin-specific deaminase-like protein
VVSRPYVLLSCATSIDGCLDDTSPHRLILSNDADLDRVDAVRAGCDAIFVGAGTVRRDRPRLLVRSPRRREERRARGLPPSPLKVTLTSTGELDPGGPFFAAGEGEKLVYCAAGAVGTARARLGSVATVVDGGDPVDVRRVLADLYERGVRRLLVEGGAAVSTWFLGAGLVDELHLAIAPFVVGEAGAPRLNGAGRFPREAAGRAVLAEVRQLDDVVLLRYRFPSAGLLPTPHEPACAGIRATGRPGPRTRLPARHQRTRTTAPGRLATSANSP